MSGTSSRYSVMMLMQIGVLVIDLLINSFAYVFISTNHYSVILLVVYLIQDGCILFAFITLVMSFFNTNAFRAGLIHKLFHRYIYSILITIYYLVLTIGWQYWTLNLRWDKPLAYTWITGVNIIYCLQRIASPVYYYLYKRSVLLMGDPLHYIHVPEVKDGPPASERQVGRRNVS